MTVINVIDTRGTPISAARSNAGCRWSTGAAAGRRLRGPAAADPFRSAQGTGRPPAGDSCGQQDRSPDARIAEVVSESHDLLLDVASDLDDEAQQATERAGPSTLFASGRAGVASTVEPANGENPGRQSRSAVRRPARQHPAATGDPEAPLQALVTNLDASAFLGRLALIRIYNGRLRKGQQVAWMREVDGVPVIANAKITELLSTVGVERNPTEEAVAGDIVAVAGMPEIMIGDTLADPDHAHALPRITVDEPAISVTIGTNTSPLAGEGLGPQADRADGQVQAGQRTGGQRLDPGRRHRPSGRLGGAGPRRTGAGRAGRTDAPEGFELTVGKPQVVTRTIDGKLHEPFEAMTIDCPESSSARSPS